MIHADQHVNDDYYKRIEHIVEDSNYAQGGGESSIIDQETDRSVGNEIDGGGAILVSVPTMFRQDDDAGTMTDGADSMYNPNYSIQTFAEVKTNLFFVF